MEEAIFADLEKGKAARSEMRLALGSLKTDYSSLLVERTNAVIEADRMDRTLKSVLATDASLDEEKAKVQAQLNEVIDQIYEVLDYHSRCLKSEDVRTETMHLDDVEADQKAVILKLATERRRLRKIIELDSTGQHFLQRYTKDHAAEIVADTLGDDGEEITTPLHSITARAEEEAKEQERTYSRLSGRLSSRQSHRSTEQLPPTAPSPIPTPGPSEWVKESLGAAMQDSLVDTLKDNIAAQDSRPEARSPSSPTPWHRRMNMVRIPTVQEMKELDRQVLNITNKSARVLKKEAPPNSAKAPQKQDAGVASAEGETAATLGPSK